MLIGTLAVSSVIDVVESQPQGSGAAVEIKRTDLMLLHSRDGSTGRKVVQFIQHRKS